MWTSGKSQSQARASSVQRVFMLREPVRRVAVADRRLRLKTSCRLGSPRARFAARLAGLIFCVIGSTHLFPAEGPKDDEQMIAALRPYRGQSLTSEQRAQISSSFATNFVPKQI